MGGRGAVGRRGVRLAGKQVLLAHGAQVNVRNRGGRTAIYYARYKGHPEMEALLLQHGAE